MNDRLEDTRGGARPVRRVALFADDARVFAEDVAPLAARLVAAGHRVRCFAPEWSDHVARLVSGSGVETDTYPTTANRTWTLMPERALRKEIAEIVEAYAPGVVAASSPRCAGLVLPAVRDPKVRRVAILDRWMLADAMPGTTIDPTRLIDKRSLGALTTCADAVVCHSAADARLVTDTMAAARTGGSAPPSIHTLPGYGVATARVEARELPETADGVVFLLTAPLDPWKGIEDYVAAARLLSESGARLRFRLQAGPGRGEAPLDLDRIEGLGAVEIVGREVGLEEAIAAAHVLVVASHHEGTPRELLAALAIGRPVIATDLPGCRAAIDEIVNGCLVPAGHPGALANACESFARRPDVLRAMGRASRKKAERRFEQDAIMRRYLEIMGLTH